MAARTGRLFEAFRTDRRRDRLSLGRGGRHDRANAIRAHFHDSAEEVEIMRLIGATHAFIILPFLLEGCLAGLLGGGLSILFLFATVQVSNAVLASIPLAGYPIAFHFFSPHLLFGFILAGGGLGGLGSFLSLRQPSS